MRFDDHVRTQSITQFSSIFRLSERIEIDMQLSYFTSRRALYFSLTNIQRRFSIVKREHPARSSWGHFSRLSFYFHSIRMLVLILISFQRTENICMFFQKELNNWIDAMAALGASMHQSVLFCNGHLSINRRRRRKEKLLNAPSAL